MPAIIDRSMGGAALESDPLSAFGGVIITNRAVDYHTALEINKLFFEVIIAPDFEQKILKTSQTKEKPNHIASKSFCAAKVTIQICAKRCTGSG